MRASVIGVTLLILSSALACNRTPPAQSESSKTDTSAQTSAAKRYHLKGKVVSIDKQAKMANIDSEAIPGFMDAMTMPYQLKPEGELDTLKPGDSITADIVVQDDNSWLENIVVTGHTASSKK